MAIFVGLGVSPGINGDKRAKGNPARPDHGGGNGIAGVRPKQGAFDRVHCSITGPEWIPLWHIHVGWRVPFTSLSW
jgi:hypothetical protein